MDAGPGPVIPPASRRGIRSFALRAGRMTDFQKTSYDSLSRLWCVPFRAGTPFEPAEIFGRKAPLVIEVGFGMGLATAEIAAALPDRDFLGIEVHTPGVGKLLGEIERRRLSNLRILHHDAVDFLETCVLPSSVSAFHIFFPDPWPKKRHHKRRLVQRPFTDFLASRLKPGGYLYFVTDWADYALQARESLDGTPGLTSLYPGAWAERETWRPATKFETRALAAGRAILELRYIKV
ncbi:MAG TPA: tRNA (guanosine(46)-N7)-methyltransferase TrmB [Magnetospirillaceae bacterium]|nr:tRNA (guanosine(46)-N7)-methyltransferase TrmB [Magnetospirillaceae bacterium]